MKKIILTLLILGTSELMAQSSFQLTCHKPLAANSGADIISEVFFTNAPKGKKIVRSSPIFIRLYQDKGEPVILNTEVMSGQSTQSKQLLLYTRDLRVHSIIINADSDAQSLVKIINGDKTAEFPANCTSVPAIPKQK